MQDRLAALEEAVAKLTHRVEELETRGGSVPAGAPAAAPSAPAAAAMPDLVPALPDVRALGTAGSLAALFGRTCLVLGGAFLIRALTEGGTLPAPLGVALGLAYALVWLALAARKGLRPFDATLHGLTALVIADPLLLEAAARMKVLPARGALTALAAVALLAFAVAAWRSIRTLAWAAALGGLGAGFALFFESYDLLGTASFCLLVGMAAWGLAETRGWVGPRWPLMIAADLLLVEAAFLVSRPGGAPEAYTGLDAEGVASAGVALAFASLAGAIAMTLIRKKDASVFEFVQTLAGLAAGLGTALHVSSGPALAGIGALSLGVGGGAYAISFAFVEKRRGRGVNFLFFASLALLMTLWATWMMFPPRALPGLWAAFGLAAAILGGRYDRVTLRAHAALYLAGAALASGQLPSSFAALAAPGGAPFPDGRMLGVLVAAAAGYAILLAMQRRPDLPAAARLPRFAVAVLVLAGLGGLATLLLARLFSGVPISTPALAVARTVVLAVSALLLAEAGRRPRFQELGWLVWPLLAAGGLKLLAEDLRVGKPATLFPAFVVYGLALWIAPRVAKRKLTVDEPAAGDPGPS